MNQKIFLAIGAILILFISACQEEEQSSPQQMQEGQTPCGDGFCDQAEQQNADLCPSDCEQATSSTTEECLQQPKQVFRQDTNAEIASDGSPITLYVATSDDGITFENSEVFVEGAGVPTVTTGPDGTLVALFNWFPEEYDKKTYNKVAVKLSTDNGATWTDPQIICLTDYPEEIQGPFDPTITTTEDGLYRLFYTTHVLGQEEQFYYGSATSEDGIHYTFEEGERFVYEDENIVDSSIVRVDDTWYMLAPLALQGGKAVDAVSTDGLMFEASTSNREDLEKFAWVGNMVNVDGTVYFYGNGHFSTTEDGKTWTALKAINLQSGDPGITYTSEGTFVILYPEAKN